MANFMSGWGSMSNFGYPSGMDFFGAMFSPIMILLIVWTLYWKYKSLWLAAKKDSKGWFIALLIINTVGILEILYIYVFSKNVVMSGHKEENVPMVPPQG